MSPLEAKACEFAHKAHAGQLRKGTGEPYITHPVAVVNILRSIHASESMLCAGWLHDVMEDCEVTRSELLALFGPTITQIVSDLTNIGTSAGNRATRARIDIERLAASGPMSQTVKLADIIHNTASIENLDSSFAAVFMSEKKRTLKVLSSGNQVLWRIAQAQIEAYFRKHPQQPRVFEPESRA